MALQLDITKKVYGQNIIIKNAYHRVEEYGGNKKEMTFKLVSYDSKIENVVEEKYYNFEPDVSDNSYNLFKQAYEYLKTKKEFELAVDI